MDKYEIRERIAKLFLSLQFCSERMKIFTAGERICINQERFQLMHMLDNPKETPRPVSLAIESKINEATALIIQYQFKPSYEDPFLSNSEIETERSEY